MSTQNITLSLPKDTLLKARLLAVRRGTSVSGLLAGELERLVSEDEAYEQARQSALMRLEQAFDLGTNGRITAGRDELHER
ncbi:MAG TPA: CopG family transcriptional regulator [Promineifilum sp.]|nr:CopG family transcriptional regulator [Promineifilum sp.]HRO23904.1 CopG family transcriptional regulator [Promineifilum sp.]HRQ14760.1 CopG family transcriptional regulator [Promineifilum sp.]